MARLYRAYVAVLGSTHTTVKLLLSLCYLLVENYMCVDVRPRSALTLESHKLSRFGEDESIAPSGFLSTFLLPGRVDALVCSASAILFKPVEIVPAMHDLLVYRGV